MAIESSALSGKYNFDLTAIFSRSKTTPNSFNAYTQTVNVQAQGRSNYSPANAFNLLETALNENLGKRVELEVGRGNESPVRTITKNVLAVVRQELREARTNGANEQQLQSIINQASEGVAKGFSEAKDILQSRLETDPRLERQIDRAFNRIQQGLQRLDNRFAPNIEAEVISQTLNNNQTNESSSYATASSEQNKTLIQSSFNTAEQIEVTKIRNVERTRSFDLSIQTQQGDTINLSIEKSFSKQLSAQATLNDQGYSVSIEKQVQREKQVSYQVSGDINDQEQAAIDALLKKVDRLSDKFYNGNIAAAFQKATRIGIDSEQLANFSLNLQSNRTVEVTKTYREVQGVPSQQIAASPVESLGEFVGDVAQVENDNVVSDVVSDPVPVATELFKQIAIRDERYAQLVFEQSAAVIDDAINGIADLAQQQLDKTG